MNLDNSMDWKDSAVKCYQSCRILNFFGYTKQSESLICISIEKFLKLYVSIINNLTEENLKKKFQHNLKHLFSDSKLSSKQFPIIYAICMKFNYNESRYDFIGRTNELNVVHKDLDKEIKMLFELIVKKLNSKYNVNIRKDYWLKVRQDRKYKEYCLKRALKGRDTILRADFT